MTSIAPTPFSDLNVMLPEAICRELEPNMGGKQVANPGIVDHIRQSTRQYRPYSCKGFEKQNPSPFLNLATKTYPKGREATQIQ